MAKNGRQPSSELRVKSDGAAKKHFLSAPREIPWFPTGKVISGKKKKKKVVYSVCLLFSPELHLAQKDRRCSMQPMCV